MHMPHLMGLLLLSSVMHFNKDYNSNSNNTNKALLDLLVLNHVLGWEIGKQTVDGLFPWCKDRYWGEIIAAGCGTNGLIMV